MSSTFFQLSSINERNEFRVRRYILLHFIVVISRTQWSVLGLLDSSTFEIVRSGDGTAMCPSDTPSVSFIARSQLHCVQSCQSKTSPSCKLLNFRPANKTCELYYYQPIWFIAQSDCVHMMSKEEGLTPMQPGLLAGSTTCDFPFTLNLGLYYGCTSGLCVTEYYTTVPCNGAGIGYTATINDYMLYEETFVAPVRSVNGWIMMTQYKPTTFDWNRPWIDYQNGFGTLDDNYWIGLNRMRETVAATSYRLRIEVVIAAPILNAWISGEFMEVQVASEHDNYRITLNGKLYGDPLTLLVQPSPLITLSGMPFSTYDRDNGGSGCPNRYGGGWWFYTGPCYTICMTCGKATCNTAGANGMLLFGTLPMPPSCFGYARALIMAE